MLIKATLCELGDTPVICVLSNNSIKGSKEAFEKLESKLPSMKQRKFYGILEGSPENDTYRACASMVNDDLKASGLTTWTIPGGKYARSKIKDWWENLHLIGPVFDELKKQYVHDSSRPMVEFYYRENILYLYLPVK